MLATLETFTPCHERLGAPTRITGPNLLVVLLPVDRRVISHREKKKPQELEDQQGDTIT